MAPWVSLRAGGQSDRAAAGALSGRPACLFIDVDGTLLKLAVRPDAVVVDGALIALIGELVDATQGATALISGRPIHALDALFAPLHLPVAGLHGFERRSADGAVHRPEMELDQLRRARERLDELVRARSGLQLEDKGYSLALHFRGAPDAEACAVSAMSTIAAALRPEFELLSGDHVLEIKPASHSKATAVEAFMGERPFQGRLPVYLGDDVTDLDGLEAVRRHGGVDIAVGGRVSARWALSGPVAVREWLRSLLVPVASVA